MKKLPLSLSSILLTLMLCSFKSQDVNYAAKKDYDGRAYDTSLQMDFTDSSEAEIKDYYNYDTMITKKGDSLKTYLHNIISTDNYFISYGSGANDGVGKWYRITDRNWYLSEEIDSSNYLFSNDTADKFYLVNCYYEASANYDKTKATNNFVNSCKESDDVNTVDYTNKLKPKTTKPDGTKGSDISIDKEHIWAKNHGFKVTKDGKDTFEKGAPTDLHHLVPADGSTNSNGHNDYFYGEVKDKSTAKISYCYYADGTSAISGYTGLDSNGNTVFEPTDEWKGDIARALLYMATRYGIELDPNTQAEPYLVFDDNGSDDNTTFHGYHPNLSTYLKWNKEDPVSEFEFHRNNLIYKNVQKNRNPYVDYPDLADWVFSDTTDTSLDIVEPVDDNPYNSIGDFSSLKDEYHVHIGNTITLDCTINDASKVNVSFDTNGLELSKDKKTFTPLKEGTYPVTYTYTDNDGAEHEYKTQIVIKSKIYLVSQKPDSGVFTTMNLVKGEEYQFELTFNKDDLFFDNESIIYEVDDSSVISVTNEGKVTALKQGTCNLSIVLKGDNDVVLNKISVTVRLSDEDAKKQKIYLVIIIACAILIVIIFLILFVIIKKTGKKVDTKVYTKVYNKKAPGKKKSSTGNTKTRKRK